MTTGTTQTSAPADNTDHPSSDIAPLSALAFAVSGLAGCGGGTPSAGTLPNASNKNLTQPFPISASQAARFLTQASMGATKADIEHLQKIGPVLWIEEQFAMPRAEPLFAWMLRKGYDRDVGGRPAKLLIGGINDALWRSLISGKDTLRQRVAFALSEIFVFSVRGVGTWRNFAAAAHMDLLLDHAFGNYRTLLGKLSRSAPMARYLTFLNNGMPSQGGSALPDENYAREIMQLFSIGLYQLNENGSLKLPHGEPVETYDQDDIMGLAKVFTGWTLDGSKGELEAQRRPLVMRDNWHATGEKSFLGTTIPAHTPGERSLELALDTIFAHPNVPPFISKQLIQRLVTSNPSAGYVGRVAAVFRDNGKGVRGDLSAVIRAILLDPEALTGISLDDEAKIQAWILPGGKVTWDAIKQLVADPKKVKQLAADPKNRFGKVREPILRFTQWARGCGVPASDEAWELGSLSDRGSRLGQSPMASPTVFNFFRPGYVPPNTNIARQNMVAPEFEIIDEVSIAGYLNFMQRVVRQGVGKMEATYSDFMPHAQKPAELVNWVSLIIAGDRLSEATRNKIVDAIATLPAKDNDGKKTRIQAAVMLTLASPEFLIVK